MEDCNCKCGCSWKRVAGLVIVGLLGAGIACCVCCAKKGTFADCTLVENVKDHMKQMKKESGKLAQEAGEMGQDLKEDVKEAAMEKAEDMAQAYESTKNAVKEQLRKMRRS